MKKIFIIIILLLSVFACSEDCNTTQKKIKKQVLPPKKTVEYKKKISNFIGVTFVYIKPGTFLMGPDYELNYYGREDEHPHKVTLTKGFYMQTTETTVGQWKRFIKDTKYKTQAEKDGFGWYRGGYSYTLGKKKGYSWKKTGYKLNDNFPVNYVSWKDCQAFVRWLSKKDNAI